MSNLLAIDIGLVNLGYSFFQAQTFVTGGTLEVKPKDNRERFKIIFDFFDTYIQFHEIQELIYEQSVMGYNKVVFHNLNIVCGLMEALAIKNHIKCFCYLPNVVKKTVTTNSKADKLEVQNKVEEKLNQKLTGSNHFVDAIAIGMTHRILFNSQTIFNYE